MKSFLKLLIPPPIRLPLRILWIRIFDVVKGARFKFAKSSSFKRIEGEAWSQKITISQSYLISDHDQVL